ncbi:zinc finger protein 431-like [Mesocricetus auratus]|uniref:Zinc finger protein 431-like n=1 Tax=Mesocricetus auratus TaxID=10036 RepID=A0ABM2YEL8_MESAU|nr:zinc finger protein 431-like [Mesocricetus auratus]
MDAVTYDDVHINFTLEEWALLNPSQKSLYKDVMLDTYRNLTAIGYSWDDHNIEEICQSSRSHRRHLQRTHTGVKTHECNQCGKVFESHGHLQIHKKTHTGGKPCVCNQCGKAYSRVSCLQIHKRTYTRVKPYECNQCGKAFAT